MKINSDVSVWEGGLLPWAPWAGYCSGGPGTAAPLVLKCDASFANLLARAYPVGPQFEYPYWMQSARFKIEAKVPAGATPDQVRIMLLNLLADRFKLLAHLVTSEAVAYEMTVAKDGPAFKLSNGSDESRLGEHSVMEGAVFLPGGLIALKQSQSMDELVRFLTAFVDHPVVDATGLAGKYDIVFRYPRADGLTWAPCGIPGGACTRNIIGTFIPDRQLVVETVRDQLGLILERTKRPFETLVIDQVEKKPSKN